MPPNSIQDFVILGGGIAGLTFALEATRRGQQVVLLESADQVGGLARTLVYGDFRFDIGGHRFHSEWQHVTAWARELMDHEMLQVVRRSRIYINGRYVEYPLEFPNALSAFDFPTALRVGASYLSARLLPNHHVDVSFEDWVVHRFGRALYNIYFRPYTEKVLGVDCTVLSADWASQRIKLPSLTAAIGGSLLRHTAHPGTMVSRFYYPALGFGEIPKRMAAKTLATGNAALNLSSRVHQLEYDSTARNWRVHFTRDNAEQIVIGKQLISTIPLGALMRLLPPTNEPPPSLGDRLVYRSLVCVFVALDGPRVSQDTWTYFSDPSVIFGRFHEPPNWSEQMAPPGKTSLALEIFCSAGDALWDKHDRELIDISLNDLARLNLVERTRVRDAWLLRVPNAYPLYKIGYQEQLTRVHQFITRWQSLHLVGRTGAFQYMNSDGVIKHTLDLVNELVPKV